MNRGAAPRVHRRRMGVGRWFGSAVPQESAPAGEDAAQAVPAAQSVDGRKLTVVEVVTEDSAADTNARFRADIIWLAKRVGTAVGAAVKLDGRRERKIIDVFADDRSDRAPLRAVGAMFQALNLVSGRWQSDLREDELPAVAVIPGRGYGFVYARGAEEAWLIESGSGRFRLAEFPTGTAFLQIRGAAEGGSSRVTAKGLFHEIFASHRAWLPLAAVSSSLASILVLGTSLYSMQVYDRVIGQGGISTLIVLTVGVMIAILIELALKVVRSGIVDRATERIDVQAAISVFQRMLSVRLDQFPASVGTLAAQVRGFETVRNFVVARAIYLTTDGPFALLFLLAIWMIAGPLIALIPAIACLIATLGGFAFRKAIQVHTTRETLVGNQRQGLLVEAIQGTELVKAAGAGWVVQAKWNELSRRTARESQKIKHINDLAGYFAGIVQQASYVALVGAGAYLAVTEKTITSGAIIACSILSGRVLTPVASIPGLLVQWAHSNIALENLERLFALESDNFGQEAPLVPEELKGKFQLRDVEFGWQGQTLPLCVRSLDLQPGERVGILGSVGAGKSTLLKLLAGVIRPARGYVLLDGLDIQQIAAERRAETIGYLPQVTRMFGGTLRENLTLGLPHVPDAEIMAALTATGLAPHIAGRPQGLDLQIPEGGEGLSRGQKQLVGLSRLLLARPTIWLLDEPTASMDDATESMCVDALAQNIRPGQTLVLVTHKPRLLDLVDRLIVLTPQGIVLDGPKAAVVAHLQNAAREQIAAGQRPAVGG